MPSHLNKPVYWDKSMYYLASVRSELAMVIARLPQGSCIERRSETAFASLARSITGQQISVKAASSIWNRLVELIVDVTPENVIIHKDQLRGCGYSAQKSLYLVDLSEHFVADDLEDRIRMTTFSSIQIDLLTIHGIGKWTTEMFGIFYMFEPDLWPVDDLGLVGGLCRCFPEESFSVEYGRTKKVTSDMRKSIVEFGQQFAPYRSVACWLLWRALDEK